MACRSLTLVVLSIALLTIGCTGGRRSSGPRDSGPRPVDTGTPPGDAATPDTSIVLMDSGTSPECDTTRPCPVGQTCVGGSCRTDPMTECDSARPCPTGRVCNASGMCVTDTGRVCPDGDVMYVTGTYCEAATATCIEGCADGACQGACLEGDPNPDCDGCANQNSISCTNSGGCQSQWDAYNCCVLDTCGAEPTSTCVSNAIDGACAGQVGAWRTCGEGVDINVSCPDWLADCF